MDPNTLFFYTSYSVFCFIVGHLIWQRVRNAERIHFDDIPRKYLWMYFFITLLFCSYLQFQHEVIEGSSYLLISSMLALAAFIGFVSSDAFNFVKEEVQQLTQEEETPIAQN